MSTPHVTHAELETHFATADPVIARLLAQAGPSQIIEVDHPRRKRSPFESLTRAIANQQLNGKVAQRILDRLVALYGDGGAFPTPQQLLATPDEKLRAVGFSYAKIAALKDLAAKTVSGVVPTESELALLSDDEIVTRLTAVRGIGRWTVEMLLIFQLGRPDVLPVDDFGVRNGFRLAYGLKGMPRTKALLAYGERWRPHRSQAAWYLWRAVDLHKDAKLPKPGRAPRIDIVVAKAKRAGKAAAKAAAKVVGKAASTALRNTVKKAAKVQRQLAKLVGKPAKKKAKTSRKSKRATPRAVSKPSLRQPRAGRTRRSPARSQNRR